MRPIHALILILSLLVPRQPLRAEGDEEPAAESAGESAVPLTLPVTPPIPPEIHYQWNEQGRTIWEMFGVAPGELEDDVQDRKRDLIRGGSPEHIVNDAWPLIKQDGFGKFYAGFVLSFGGTENFKAGSGAIHILLMNRYYAKYKLQPISLLWNVSEKLEHLAIMLQETGEFAEIYDSEAIEKIKNYAQELRTNRAIELRRSSGTFWGNISRSETWNLAVKAKWLAAAGIVCAISLASYHKGARDYAPKPADVILEKRDPLPAATDVRNPAHDQSTQKAADDAAIKRGDEARKLFDN